MDVSLQKDFYAVLAIARDAPGKEIKRRFRELARERHPDRVSGPEKAQAELDFQDITEAFNVLMDPVRRRQVDLYLARPAKARHDPQDVIRVYLNRGIRAYKDGNYLEAANNFDRATQTDPSSYQAWHHLALTCVKETRWLSKAQEAIQHAIELRPNHVPYLKLAGKIFAQSGMTPRAKQYYNQALQVGGSDSSVKKALQELAGGPQQVADSAPKGERPGLFRKMW